MALPVIDGVVTAGGVVVGGVLVLGLLLSPLPPHAASMVAHKAAMTVGLRGMLFTAESLLRGEIRPEWSADTDGKTWRLFYPSFAGEPTIRPESRRSGVRQEHWN